MKGALVKGIESISKDPGPVQTSWRSRTGPDTPSSSLSPRLGFTQFPGAARFCALISMPCSFYRPFSLLASLDPQLPNGSLDTWLFRFRGASHSVVLWEVPDWPSLEHSLVPPGCSHFWWLEGLPPPEHRRTCLLYLFLSCSLCLEWPWPSPLGGSSPACIFLWEAIPSHLLCLSKSYVLRKTSVPLLLHCLITICSFVSLTLCPTSIPWKQGFGSPFCILKASVILSRCLLSEWMQENQ